MNPEKPDGYYTAAEIAAHFGCDHRRIYEVAAVNALPFQTFRDRHGVTKAWSLDDFEPFRAHLPRCGRGRKRQAPAPAVVTTPATPWWGPLMIEQIGEIIRAETPAPEHLARIKELEGLLAAERAAAAALRETLAAVKSAMRSI